MARVIVAEVYLAVSEGTRRAGTGGDGRMTKREPTDMEKNAATVIDGTAAGLLQARRRGRHLGKNRSKPLGLKTGKQTP